MKSICIKKRFLSKALVFVSMVSLLMGPGCAWFEVKQEESVESLASKGMEAFAKEKYRSAIESFEKLKDWYPFSKFASLAELKIADSHYHLKAYEEAVFAYEEFETLHPRNEAIPYVIYQIGRCSFEQLESVDRDQTSTQKALATFNRLVREFPENEYAQKARDHIRKCKENLAQHEFYVGRFYYKNKNYKAALKRFESVLFNYPEVNIHQDAQQYVSRCKAELKN